MSRHLCSLQGFRYCDLLLAEPELAAWQRCCQDRTVPNHLPTALPDINAPKRPPRTTQAPNATSTTSEQMQSCHAVAQRAAQTIQWTEQNNGSLLDIALDHLTLGRAALFAAILDGTPVTACKTELKLAVDGLRRAGTIYMLPLALLTRAWQLAHSQHYTGPASAQADLDEAWEIAESGPMPLLLADIHLYRAGLFQNITPYPWQSAALDLREARRLIEKHGYLRRMRQLEATEEAIGLEASAQSSALEIPNPFTVGIPIQPNGLWSKNLFPEQERTVAQVVQLLNDANNYAIALIGPRRSGKSSLLNILPLLLPDSIIVQFDLQANPADTPMRFYQELAKVAQNQARRNHNLELPSLDDSAASPIEALKQWFEQLENFTSVPRILLCIDEFERLETLFPDRERELPQFMGVIRATIQHKRRLRLLVAGTTPFAELGPIWNDHFINLREIKIGYFDHATATGLLIKPMPEFPDGTISQAVADEVFARSKGQPFLTQAYGHGLVNILNAEKRKQATMADLERLEPEILQNYTYYFHGIWQEIPPAGQAVLASLAHGQRTDMDAPTRLWLRRRMLITDDGLLAIPLFGRWIREKDLA